METLLAGGGVVALLVIGLVAIAFRGNFKRRRKRRRTTDVATPNPSNGGCCNSSQQNPCGCQGDQFSCGQRTCFAHTFCDGTVPAFKKRAVAQALDDLLERKGAETAMLEAFEALADNLGVELVESDDEE